MTDKSVIAIGSFASFHPGHIELLERTVDLAKKYLSKSCVLTFDNALDAHKGTKLFMDKKQKNMFFERIGIDEVCTEKFDDSLKNMSPEEFVTQILKEKFNAVCVVVGENFHFGKNALGDTESLKRLCAAENIDCEVMPLKKDIEGNVISTSYLIRLASEGKVEMFAEILGRPLKICGNVIHGRHDGTKIGFPTVNVKVEKSAILPGRGVYASLTRVGNEEYRSVTNIGNAPTFGSDEELTETYIMGLNRDLYGQNIEIKIYKKIRNISKFTSIEELKNQINKDVLAVEEYFKNKKIIHIRN